MDDSDGENDQFESAEESLSEDEESDARKKVEKPSDSSDGDKPVVAESCCSTAEDDSSGLGKVISHSDPVTYRKRPEKAKALPRKSSKNTVLAARKDAEATESTFKPDLPAPDQFFQDITTNLSANFNKSLSTIQQTSSNVKDLIMNSLPVTGAKQSEGFSYDAPLSDGDCAADSDLVQSGASEVMDEELKEEEQNVEGTLPIKSNNVFDGEILPSIIKQEGDEKKLFDVSPGMKVPDVSEIYNLSMNSMKPQEPEGKDKKQKKPRCIFEPSERENILQNIHTKNKNEGKAEGRRTPNENLLKARAEDLSNIFMSNQFGLSAESPVPDSKTSANENSSSKPSVKSGSDKSSSERFSGESAEVSRRPTSPGGNSMTFEVDTDRSLTESGNSVGAFKAVLSEDNYMKLHKEMTRIDQITEEKNINWNDPLSSLVDNMSRKSQSDHIGPSDRESEQGIDQGKAVTTSSGNINNNKSALGEQSSSQSNQGQKQSPMEDNDGWDDFDFSDGENENDSLEGTSFTSLNDGFMDGGSGQKESKVSQVPASGGKTGRDESDRQSAGRSDRKSLPRQEVEMKRDKLDEMSGERTDDGWNDWDDWGDSSENVVEPVQTTRETDEDKAEKVWSGWDKFGQKEDEKQSNWGSWGVNMLLNKATAVTQGISSALEAGLGAPDPETLARMEKRERTGTVNPTGSGENPRPAPEESSTDSNLFSSALGLTNLVAGVTNKIVEHAKIQEIGAKVITGSLDTLESFGKKTMEVLQDGDPGLRNKRALFMGSQKPVASEALREIRDKAEREMKQVEEKEMERKCHFDRVFDDFQGMVHLEALEMLSKQCTLKLEQIRTGMSTSELEDLNGILEEVEQLCTLDEYDINVALTVGNFKTALTTAIEPLKEEISVNKIVEIQENIERWLKSDSVNGLSPASVQQKLVSTLAQLTAGIVHQFHKAGEMLSVKECRKTVEEIDALSGMTHILSREVGNISKSFIELSKKSFQGTANLDPLLKRIDEAATNSTTYIRQGFNLLMPILQVGAAV